MGPLPFFFSSDDCPRPGRSSRRGAPAHPIDDDAFLSVKNRGLPPGSRGFQEPLTAIVIQVAVGVPAPLRSLADQAIRAASSVALNLAEGAVRSGRDRLHHWRIAYGSALEVGSALTLLAEVPGVDRPRVATAAVLFDRVRAMTWRLLHPRGPR